MPGGLTTLFVKGLRGIEGTSVVTQYPAGPELVAGVTVKIYGLPVPVLLVSQLDGYHQINVQVSWKADVTVKPAVEVRQGGEVAVVDAVPEGAFDALYAGDDESALAIKSSDWSRVTADNPLRSGESFLLFGANMGPVTPAMRLHSSMLRYCGQLSPGARLATQPMLPGQMGFCATEQPTG